MLSSIGATPAASSSVASRDGSTSSRDHDGAKTKASSDRNQLTAEQQRAVQELQARDREVRAHESAHKAVGGSLAGSASFSYQTGPDGRQYAIGGDVSIDTGGERDPQAMIAKMRQVIAAAQAPAQPSAQDQAVAAQARSAMAAAQGRLAQQVSAERQQAGAKPDAASAGDAAIAVYGSEAEPTGGLVDLFA